MHPAIRPLAIKTARAFRLTDKARELLLLLKDHLGISQVAALEIAISEAAKKRSIHVESRKP